MLAETLGPVMEVTVIASCSRIPSPASANSCFSPGANAHSARYRAAATVRRASVPEASSEAKVSFSVASTTRGFSLAALTSEAMDFRLSSSEARLSSWKRRSRVNASASAVCCGDTSSVASPAAAPTASPMRKERRRCSEADLAWLLLLALGGCRPLGLGSGDSRAAVLPLSALKLQLAILDRVFHEVIGEVEQRELGRADAAALGVTARRGRRIPQARRCTGRARKSSRPPAPCGKARSNRDYRRPRLACAAARPVGNRSR